jgi:hypothetical protein
VKIPAAAKNPGRNGDLNRFTNSLPARFIGAYLKRLLFYNFFSSRHPRMRAAWF